MIKAQSNKSSRDRKRIIKLPEASTSTTHGADGNIRIYEYTKREACFIALYMVQVKHGSLAGNQGAWMELTISCAMLSTLLVWVVTQLAGTGQLIVVQACWHLSLILAPTLACPLAREI